MFAGIAVCSMPTVHKFFNGKKGFTTSWQSSQTYVVERWRRMITRTRSAGDDSTMIENEWPERFRMRDLESKGQNYEANNADPNSESQIHLRQDFIVTREAKGF